MQLNYYVLGQRIQKIRKNKRISQAVLSTMKRLPPLSEMERIEQTLLVEKLDEILERIDNEDIGFVITENGLPDMVLIPFRWFAENFPDEVPDGL